MKNPDLSRQFKFHTPIEEGEEHLVFEIVNYNEVTGRVYVRPVDECASLIPQFLVSLEDLIYAE